MSEPRPPAGLKARLRARTNRWRARFGADLDRPLARAEAGLDALIFDHGFFRIAWRNLHEIAPGVWRSNQPSPRQIRALYRRGLKAIVNLRGASRWGSYVLERDTAARLGIEMVDCRLYSRRLPTRADILALDATFRRLPRPFLMHCKSGADRAGLGAALYLLLIEGADPDRARRQLSLRYLHVRQGPTGILDHMLDAYAADHAAMGIGFRDWVAHRYDPEALTETFRAGRAGTWLVDRMLRRE